MGHDLHNHFARQGKRKESESLADPIEFGKDQHSILMDIKDQYELKALAEMKTPYRIRYKSKYCHFHKDCGHGTNKCKHLKRDLEDLTRKDEFILASRGKEVSEEG